MDYKSRLILILVGILSFLLSALTYKQIGISWDEGPYLESTYLHREWLRGNLKDDSSRFSLENLSIHWSRNLDRDAHPSFVKIVACIFTWFDGQDISLAHARLTSALFFSIGTAGIFWAACSRWGMLSGLFASLAWVGMPRIFGHSQFLALDIPVAVIGFLISWIMITKYKKINWKTIIFLGVLTGFGFLTKLNAFFIPVPILIILIFERKFKITAKISLVYPIGLTILFLGWPRLWISPLRNFAQYIYFHMQHFPVNVFYLGNQYNGYTTPWHYPFVMICVTTPILILLCSWLGIWKKGFLKDKKISSEQKMMFLSGMLPLLILAMPGTPAYDGIRLLFPTIPWIALAAGRGASRLSDWIKHKTANHPVYTKIFQWVLGFSIILPTLLSQPHSSDYYSVLVKGPGGAYKLGFESTYWGQQLDSTVIGYLNNNTPENANLWITPFSYKILQHLQGQNMLRKDITFSLNKKPDLVVLHHRRGGWGDFEKTLSNSATPILVHTRESLQN